MKCKTCSRIKERGLTTESKPTVEIKTVITLVNMVDVNVTTQSKTSEEHVFKDQKPRKNKSAANWEVEEKLKRFVVKIMQQM
jgi:hypothetical protein